MLNDRIWIRSMEQAVERNSPRFVFDWVRRNVGKKGAGGVLNFALSHFSDYWFDYRYGTTTGGWVAPDKLNADSENQQHSVHYQATKYRPFRSLLKTLSFPEGSVFVDVGCGKGKALLIASRFGFKKALGIEFSPELCQIARENAKIFQSRIANTSEIEIVQSDVLDYQMTHDENVFYLYNPFNEVVMRRFLSRVARSMDEKHRKVWIIYHIAEHGAAIEEHGRFGKAKQYTLGGTEFAVYEST
ncbi:MAG TPA: class I SAM-dependent methyltransferase [Azospirillum sp.]|nr:class I SAM-dependent methyltransferase [Azospirillum sp.]